MQAVANGLRGALTGKGLVIVQLAGRQRTSHEIMQTNTGRAVEPLHLFTSAS